MADKTPIRTVFNSDNIATGLAEFQSGETVPLNHGGTGVALSIGSAGQVLKVNSGASALEFGAVEAIVNIDNATNLTSATLATGDQILISDGGTEGRATLAQIDTLFSGTSKTLTNKTLTTPVLTTPIANAGIQLKNGATSAGFLEFFEDSDNGTNKATLIGPASTADVTITLPATTDTLVARTTTDTFTNKSIDLATNTITGSLAEFNSALQSESFVSLTGSETLTNKTLTTPVLTTPIANAGIQLKNAATSAGFIEFFEDSNNGTNKVTLIGPASTADVTVTLPAVAGTVITTANSDAATTTTDASDADFVLVDDGGTLKKISTTNLGIVDNTGFDTSSFITPPGTDGNFDLAKIQAQTGSAETGLTASTIEDAFGRRIATTPEIYDLMDPEFQNLAVDYGSVAS